VEWTFGFSCHANFSFTWVELNSGYKLQARSSNVT
jgi:hypothetical protein